MRSRLAPCFLLIFTAALFAAPAFSAQMVSTTARGLNAVTQAGGFMIQSAGTAPASYSDLAPQQLLEIVRPGNRPFTIGRMFTSCTCVRLEADARSYGAGERAVLRLRNVVATPPSGQNYAVYVQITSPIKATLRYDTFMQSSQFVPAAEGFAPTRGNVISDGYIIGNVPAPAGDDATGAVATAGAIYSGTDIEVIVPKADNYIPDTSAYTLRKKAEAEAAEKKTSSRDKDTAQSGVPSGDEKTADTASEKKAFAAAKTTDDEPDSEAKPDAPAGKDDAGATRETSAAAKATTQAAKENTAEKRDADAGNDAGKTAENAVRDGEEKTGPAASAPVETTDGSARSTETDSNSLWTEVGRKAKSAGRDAESALETTGDAVKQTIEAVAEEASTLGEKIKDAAISAADAVADTAEKAEEAGKDAADVLKDEMR